MTNVMVKTCLNHKIIKKSNLIKAMKNNVCPKATVTIRRPNFFENWICPKIHRMFRSVDWTHDMIVVKWREGTVIQYFRKPNLSEYLPNVPECSGVRIEHTTQWWWSDTYSFDTSAHLALWQMRHRFNPRKRVNDYQLYSMIPFFRKPNLSKNLRNVLKRGLNTRHDNREVTWSDSYSIFSKAEFVRIMSEYLPKCGLSEVRIEHTTW